MYEPGRFLALACAGWLLASCGSSAGRDADVAVTDVGDANDSGDVSDVPDDADAAELDTGTVTDSGADADAAETGDVDVDTTEPPPPGTSLTGFAASGNVGSSGSFRAVTRTVPGATAGASSRFRVLTTTTASSAVHPPDAP